MRPRVSNPELLAPAGDMEALEAAVRYGADACYLGLKTLNLRAGALNFTEEELAQAAAYAHARGVKIYLALNALPRDSEFERLPGILDAAVNAHADALIVADLGIARVAKRLHPELPLHISTQFGAVNSEAVRALAELGAKRVVLARELSLSQAAAIARNTDGAAELEMFVHGAMCVSFSGRCLLSEYLTGRDANSGECAQPCRSRYALCEESRPGEYFPLAQTEDGSYLLNSKDLCLISRLGEILGAGISALKIEGRGKSAYYVATVTNAYRAALDFLAEHPERSLPGWIPDEVNAVSHRPYTEGFFDGKPKSTVARGTGGYESTRFFAGVLERVEGGRIFLTQRNRFFEGDTLELLRKGQPPLVLTVRDLRDEAMKKTPSASHAMMRCSFEADAEIPRWEEGLMLRGRVQAKGG